MAKGAYKILEYKQRDITSQSKVQIGLFPPLVGFGRYKIG